MRVLTAAVITADPDLRRLIRECDAISITVEIPVAATEVGVEELNELEARRPELVVVDVGDAPQLGLRLVEFLAEAAPGRPVLAAGPTPSAELLLEAMRAGAQEYLETPPTPEVLRGVVERLARRLAPSTAGAPREGGRVYTFVGVKGGIGTTTIASNVAVELRRRSEREVLLADFHFGLGDVAVHLGLTPRFHVVDLVESLHRMDRGLLASLVESDETGIQVLASPGEAEKIDAVTPEQVREVLRFLRTQYAYTVVDAPDPYSRHARAIFAESDRILLVATPEVSALRNVARVLPLLEAEDTARPREVTLVVNRFVPSRSVPPDEIQRLVGLEVQRTITNDYESVTRSINEGTPIVHGRSVVARDLARLAADLHERPEEPATQRTGLGARLRRSLAGWTRGSGRSDPSSPDSGDAPEEPSSQG